MTTGETTGQSELQLFSKEVAHVWDAPLRRQLCENGSKVWKDLFPHLKKLNPDTDKYPEMLGHKTDH